jgi:hypothetical protein
MNRSLLFVALAATVASLPAAPAAADTFGSGANSFTIEFVTIGNPGNPAYPSSPTWPEAGAVSYQYRMSTYEISEDMVNKAIAAGAVGITIDARGPNRPATSVTWHEAARFVNWLNSSTGNHVAYNFNSRTPAQMFILWTPRDPGYDPNNPFRNRLAKYFLPSLDEWTKAAYYDPIASRYWTYPTGSNSIPDGVDIVGGDPDFDAVFYDGGLRLDPRDITNVGLPSPYGTFGQGGNVYEWLETTFDRRNIAPDAPRINIGGSWDSIYALLAASTGGRGDSPSRQFNFTGFRVASIPEPNTAAILATAFLLLRWRSRRPTNSDKLRLGITRQVRHDFGCASDHENVVLGQQGQLRLRRRRVRRAGCRAYPRPLSMSCQMRLNGALRASASC